MTEYRLKVHSTPLTLFKTHSMQVQRILYKKSGFFTMHLESPNLLKERLGYKNIRSAVKTPVQSLYISIVSHSRKIIDIFPVDGIYKFENVFTTSKDSQKLTTKMISKEELEHRKRSIHYKVKKLEMEDEIEMNYENEFDIYQMTKRNEDIINTDLPRPQKDNLTFEKSIYNRKDLIQKSIYGARIINYSDLNEIYENHSLINEVLSEMCIPFQGRFVLKQNLYKPELRKLRNYVLDLFKAHQSIDPLEISAIQNLDFLFLIQEISTKKNGRYYLKGQYEDYTLEKPRYDIKSIISKGGIFSKEDLQKILKIDLEDVMSAIEADCSLDMNIKILKNQTYVYDDKSNPIRSGSIEFLIKTSVFKRNDLFKYLHDQKNLEMSHVEFSRIVKEFCIPEGNSWKVKSHNSENQ